MNGIDINYLELFAGSLREELETLISLRLLRDAGTHFLVNSPLHPHSPIQSLSPARFLQRTRTGIRWVDSEPVPEQTGRSGELCPSKMVPVYPVSSLSSRSAACSFVSPSSINPPGYSMQ